MRVTPFVYPELYIPSVPGWYGKTLSTLPADTRYFVVLLSNTPITCCIAWYQIVKDGALVKTLDTADAARVALINDANAIPKEDELNSGIFNAHAFSP